MFDQVLPGEDGVQRGALGSGLMRRPGVHRIPREKLTGMKTEVREPQRQTWPELSGKWSGININATVKGAFTVPDTA